MNIFYLLFSLGLGGVFVMEAAVGKTRTVRLSPAAAQILSPVSSPGKVPQITLSLTQRLLSNFRNKVPTPNDPEDIMIAISEGKVDVGEAKAYETWYYKERLTSLNWNQDANYLQFLIASLSVKRGWSLTPNYLRSSYTNHARWGTLTEEQRYFSYRESISDLYDRSKFPPNLDQLSDFLQTNAGDIRLKMIRNVHSGDRFDITPQSMWLLSKIRPGNLNRAETRILAQFGGEMNDWPALQTAAWKEYQSDTKMSRFMDQRLQYFHNLYLRQPQGLSALLSFKPLKDSERNWMMNRPFRDLSSIQKQFVTRQFEWKELDEEKRFWLMLSKFGLDSTWTKAELEAQLRTDPTRLVAHVSKYLTGYEETPLRNLWIATLPVEQRTAQQSEMLAAYPESYFAKWPNMVRVEFKDLNDFAKARAVDQRLAEPGYPRQLDQAKVDWLNSRSESLDSSLVTRWRNRNIWSKLPEETQFQSFKMYFQNGDPAFNLKTFKERIANDLPALRLQMLPTMERQDRYDGETAEQLYWILSIPKAERTNYEKGFVNNYGYGVFDDFGKSQPYFGDWKDRSLSDKVTRGFEDNRYPERQLWLKEFTKTMKDVFGPVEAKNIDAAKQDLQSWFITYFYRNSGSLSAAQKNWGWTYFATLKSPQGKQAFEDLTLQLAMDKNGFTKSNFRIQPKKI